MKHTELRAAVLDALEKHDTGATLFDGRPAVFDEEDFPAIAVYLTGAEYTGEELDSDTWQAELHIEVFLPAQVPDSELDSWMESRIYPVMSDIPALSDLITSMVASGYDYIRQRYDQNSAERKDLSRFKAGACGILGRGGDRRRCKRNHTNLLCQWTVIFTFSARSIQSVIWFGWCTDG